MRLRVCSVLDDQASWSADRRPILFYLSYASTMQFVEFLGRKSGEWSQAGLLRSANSSSRSSSRRGGTLIAHDSTRCSLFDHLASAPNNTHLQLVNAVYVVMCWATADNLSRVRLDFGS